MPLETRETRLARAEEERRMMSDDGENADEDVEGIEFAARRGQHEPAAT